MWTIYPFVEKGHIAVPTPPYEFLNDCPFSPHIPETAGSHTALKTAKTKHKSLFYYLASALQYHDTESARNPRRRKSNGYERRRTWKQKKRQRQPAVRNHGFWKRSRSKSSQSTASAECTEMATAGIRMHPACRVRREGFGLLFYDARGPRLLFAATGNLLPEEYFETARSRDELPEGLSEGQRRSLAQFVDHLLEKGFLREQ